MAKIKACAIIRNRAGELLLQRRDEEPEIGKWFLFGGGVREGETEEEALRREIKEELELDLGNVHFFGRYVDSGIEQAIFASDTPAEIQELKLREGAEMRFFPAAELQSLAIGFNFKRIIGDYLSGKF